MKPRTKLQITVVESASNLFNIGNDQKNWAKKECLEHKGYATKKSVLCLDCGDSFSTNLVSKNKATCPNCKTKIQVKQSRCTTDRQVNYFAITEVVNEFQVVRNFEIIANYKKGRKANYFIQEILQYWISPEKKITMYGLQHYNNWFMDSWGGKMEIRIENKRSWNNTKYDVYARNYHPESQIKKDYLKLGIDCNLKGISFLEAIRLIPNNPKAETLIKLKEYDLLSFYNRQCGVVSRYWSSLKIAMRHNYKIKDASMYFDYLELLRYFNKDLHSPKFLCPKNLRLEHNRFLRKKQEIKKIHDLEIERKKIIERQKKLEKAILEYVERNNKFFHLEFKEKDITIKILQSVQEFLEEGTELKHCVYENEYYLKENSLIFSARVNGKRTETIEVILSKMIIEQSRGYDNKPSVYNKEILDLMKKNLNKIRSVLENSKENKIKTTIYA